MFICICWFHLHDIAHLRQECHDLKFVHFWVIGKKRNVCRCTFNRYSVITQFAKLATGVQLCRRCTHRKLQHFKTFKSFSWKITNFQLWHCCANERYDIVGSSDTLFGHSEWHFKADKMQFSVVMRCERRILFCFKNKIVVGTIYTVV